MANANASGKPPGMNTLVPFIPSQTLNDNIWKYYDQYTHNDAFKKKQEDAYEIFKEDVEDLVTTDLHQGHLTGQIVVGSFPEGTYINDNGIEFDVNIIVKPLNRLEFEIKPSQEYHGFVTLVDKNDPNHLLTHGDVLDPIMTMVTLILNTSEPLLHDVMRNRQTHGPAIKVDKWGPKHSQNKVYHYTADIAPAFEVTQEQMGAGSEATKDQTTQIFVAKGPSKFANLNFSYVNRFGETCVVRTETKEEKYKDILHRLSTSNKETDTISSLSEEKRAVLRICKQMVYMMNKSSIDFLKVKETNDAAKVLDSYFLKNALLHAVFRTDLKEADWAREHTTQRVIDIWKQIYTFLESGNFPAYFSGINLLLSVPNELQLFLMDRVASFLTNEEAFWKRFDRNSLGPIEPDLD